MMTFNKIGENKQMIYKSSRLRSTLDLTSNTLQRRRQFCHPSFLTLGLSRPALKEHGLHPKTESLNIILHAHFDIYIPKDQKVACFVP